MRESFVFHSEYIADLPREHKAVLRYTQSTMPYVEKSRQSRKERLNTRYGLKSHAELTKRPRSMKRSKQRERRPERSTKATNTLKKSPSKRSRKKSRRRKRMSRRRNPPKNRKQKTLKSRRLKKFKPIARNEKTA